ncbi:MAG: ribosome biogenesis GTPase Der [Aestuariivita sp.]|nr:ribosome biogenesis GTPase Der [Aestuariivita sp.]
MGFKLVIVGRPNVGKSTLFNRLIGKRIALVDDQPGVTRDLREGEARYGDLKFTVVDTAGFEFVNEHSFSNHIRRLTASAIKKADVILFLIDARVGVTPFDEEIANLLRKRAISTILGANKAESAVADHGVLDAYRLGLGEPIRLSAEHGLGLSELFNCLQTFARELNKGANSTLSQVGVTVDDENDQLNSQYGSNNRPIQVSIVGRPNAGKSTLFNAILGEERQLTGPEAGITRDAISITVDWAAKDRAATPMRIFDTAGMRKKAKVHEKLEKLSVSDGLRAIKFSEIIIVLLDATISFEQQDLRIADLAQREGRAVVIAVNKWDIVKRKQSHYQNLHEACERLLPQLRGVPLVPISARTRYGLTKLHESILGIYELWNWRAGTAELNRWLACMLEAHPPPAPRGKRIKMRYMTQIKTRPPEFVVMCSAPSQVPDSYNRYLINGLRVDFGLMGVPLRLILRDQGGRNPFKGRKNKLKSSKLKKHLQK